MSFIYLASPYSHVEFAVRYWRYAQAAEAVLEISRTGLPVYSPIVHWHSIATEQGLPTDYEFWKQQDQAMIRPCTELWILCIDGWRQSKGIEAEKAFAQGLGKRIRFMTFASLGETCSIYQAQKHAELNEKAP